MFKPMPWQVEQMRKELAKEAYKPSTTTWQNSLPAALRVRLNGYRKLERFQQLSGSGIVADITQTPASHPILSNVMPRLLRGSQLWSFTRSRLVTPREQLVSMGLPVYKNPPIWQHACKDRELKSLAGNGMSSPVLGAILAYLLTHLRSTVIGETSDEEYESDEPQGISRDSSSD